MILDMSWAYGAARTRCGRPRIKVAMMKFKIPATEGVGTVILLPKCVHYVHASLKNMHMLYPGKGSLPSSNPYQMDINNRRRFTPCKSTRRNDAAMNDR